MKVIGINGSARRDGNTALIIGKVFEELNKEGIETELIQLADYDIQPCHLEKAREFDPFGHAGLTPLGIIRLTPSGKIKMTPVEDTAGEFFCSFENPCPGTAGFNVKYYKI